MKLCPDLLRLVVSFLPSTQIYSLLLDLGDFTNEWFWQAKLIQDYPHAPLEQGLKFTHTYAKLYQKYYQFRQGKIGKVIRGYSYKKGCDRSLLSGKLGMITYGNHPHRLPGPIEARNIHVIPMSDINAGDVLRTLFIRNGKVSNRLYLYDKDRWIRVKKLKLIDQCPIEFFDRTLMNDGFVYKPNLTPYLDQIRQNQYLQGNVYLSWFLDWRGVKYQIGYPSVFNEDLPKKWFTVTIPRNSGVGPLGQIHDNTWGYFYWINAV